MPDAYLCAMETKLRNMKKVMGKGWIFVVASFVAACLASCAVGRSSVAGPGLLDGYDYAVLKVPESGYGGRADLACVQSEIFSALDATRLDMVGDMSVGDLTEAEKRRLLVVRFTVSLDDDVAVVSATLADYATGRPVATVEGSSSEVLLGGGECRAAAKAAKEIKKQFGVDG